jgi:hypothetical protein
MSVDEYNDAIECMINIEAQDTLNQIMVITWPNMKQKDREKMHKKLYRQAYPDSFKEAKQLTLADVLGKV